MPCAPTTARPLTEALLARVDQATRGLLESEDEIEKALARLVEEGHAAWPELPLDPEAFVARLAERSRPAERAALSSLRSIHAADLHLAMACTQGQPVAIAEVTRRLQAESSHLLRSSCRSAALADEALQVLRVSVLVGQGNARAAIDSFSGRGSLASFLRAAAVRTAANLRRREARQVGAPELCEALASTHDIEIEFIKRRYRDDFASAFAEAIASLSCRERNVLRLHVIDGLNIEEIGKGYHVHRATVARWIARVRDLLLETTRQRLAVRLRLAQSEAQSLLGLLRSQLDLSLARLLDEADTDASDTDPSP